MADAQYDNLTVNVRLGILAGKTNIPLNLQTARPLTVRSWGPYEESISLEDSNGVVKWHINQNWNNIPGLNFSETGVADARLFIKAGGNIGIGTANPSAKLDVNGSINVSGDVLLVGADCAEDFDIIDMKSVQPGTVMVIDNNGSLRPSEQAYDKRVAGVISGAGDYKPGIVLDKQVTSSKRLPVALVGKTFCKVDANYSPIAVGDLITSSDTFGHGMKANDPLKAFGAVVGKALCSLESGKGLIPILITLQ